MLDADRIVPIVGNPQVVGRTPIDAKSEILDVPRPDLVILGDVVAIGRQHEGRAGGRPWSIVTIVPIPSVPRRPGDIGRSGVVSPHGRCATGIHVLACVKLERCFRIAEQVVSQAEPRGPIASPGQRRKPLEWSLCRHEATPRRPRRLHIPTDVLKPDPRIYR